MVHTLFQLPYIVLQPQDVAGNFTSSVLAIDYKSTCRKELHFKPKGLFRKKYPNIQVSLKVSIFPD